MPTNLSINGAAFMLSCEGWSDATAKNYMGKIGTDATAGCNRKIDKATTITVGPGLTNYLNKSAAKFKPIQDGVRFTAAEIIKIWVAHTQDGIKDILRRNPKLGQMSQ